MIVAPLNPRVRRAVAGLGLLGLLVGLPVVLALLVGWPLPRALPDAGALSGLLEGRTPVHPMVVLKALAIVCWLAWAEIVACAVVEVRAALGKAAVRVPLAGPLQPLVARLVAATMVGVLVFGARDAASASAAQRAVATETLLVPVDLVSQVETVPPDAVYKPAGPPIERHIERVTVQPRDTLWDLAEEHLGDPLRWREIFELNQLRVQPDGRMLVDPDLIQPGWILDLPARELMPATGEPEVCEIAPTAPSPAPEASDRPDSGDEQGGEVSDDQGRGNPLRDPEPLEEPDHPGPAGPSVLLPGGSVVPLVVASAVAAALTTIGLKRRRRYSPSPPAPAAWSPSDQRAPATRRLVRQIVEASGHHAESQEEATPFAFRGLHKSEQRGLVVGERDQKAVHLDLPRLGGLALTGGGAESALRSIAVTALSEGCPAVQEVLMSRPAAEQLLPGKEEFDGLRIVPGVEKVFEIAEVELLRRKRLLQETGMQDLAALREQTGEPVAELMVILDGRDAGDPARIKAVSGLGGSAGMSLVVLGECPTCESRIDVDPDGRTSNVAPSDLADHLDGARLHRMTATECVEVLGVFATATVDEDDEAAVGSEEPVVGSSDVEPEPPPTKPSEVALVPESGSLIKVRLFGPYRIEVAGEEIRKGLRSSARELLAYYLLHPEGARAEAAIDALWPEADLSRGQERFWTALGNLRSTIRKLLPGEHQLIEKRGELYVVEPGVFDVDVWRFQEALVLGQPEARTAEGEHLKKAVECQGTEMLEGSYYGWAEPLREEMRRKGLDACVHLAQWFEGHGDKEGALETIERGIRLDPYAEYLYQEALRITGELDRPETARRLLQRLADRLSQIDADPSEPMKRFRATVLSPSESLE